MKKVFFLLLTLLSVTQLSFAQKAAKQHPQASPEMRAEMRNYVEQNVQPVLLQSQRTFDTKLSSEDLAFIQKKRVEATAIREKRQKLHLQAQKLRKEGKSRAEIHEILDIDKDAMKAQRTGERELMKAFMERNKETLKSTMDALKPSYKQWIKEEKNIVQKYIKEGRKSHHSKKGKSGERIGLFGLMPSKMHKKERGYHPRTMDTKTREDCKKEENCTHKKGHKGKKGKKRHFKENHRLTIEFVLWDGNLPAERDETLEPTIFQERKADNISIQNYPNPATGMTKISVDLAKPAQTVNISLRDQSGKLVKDLTFKDVDKGFNEFEINVSDLPDGVYFYTFKTDEFSVTKRMVVGK